jgi:hypothetical protein
VNEFGADAGRGERFFVVYHLAGSFPFRHTRPGERFRPPSSKLEFPGVDTGTRERAIASDRCYTRHSL